MKKKWLQILAVICSMFLVLNISMPFALANSTDNINLGHKTISDKNKSWTIQFSQVVDKQTVNKQNLYILDSNGEKISSAVKADGKNVTISPLQSYNLNSTYTVYIESDIQSLSTKKLLDQDAYITFTLENSTEEPLELSEPIVYPSSTVHTNYNGSDFRLIVSLPIKSSELKEYDVATGKSSVKLFQSTNNGSTWKVLGSLFDSGNMALHSDEIAGDGYYSVGLSDKLDTKVANSHLLKVEVTLKDDTSLSTTKTVNVIETVQPQDVEEAEIIYENVENQVIDQFATKEATVETVKEVVKTALQSNEVVVDVQDTDGMIEVSYESGLKSYINIAEENEDLGVRSIASPREVQPIGTEREQTNVVEPEQQTTGDLPIIQLENSVENDIIMPFAAGTEEITNRNVLLWSPFAEEFHPWNEENKLQEIFNASSSGFNVSKLTGTAANIDSLKHMTNYGFVLLSTHGSGGKWVLTGEPIESSKYLVEQATGQIAMTQNYIVTTNGSVKVKMPVYAVNHLWFSNNLVGEFDNTIIINSSCQSTLKPFLSNVFSSLGAGAYYGYTGNVTSKFAYQKAIEITDNLVNKNKTTSQAFKFGEKDPYINNGTIIELIGKGNLAFSTSNETISGLVNGNFEQVTPGTIVPTAWSVFGDGRAISGLGGLVYPTNGKNMAVISTGLGFTESLGEISQTFYLSPNSEKLSFDWNYLSEEFLGYIGSYFDDPFVVTLSSGSMQEEVLYLSVNTLAAMFGATQDDGGQLIPVSPYITFDRGDVWMTNWRSTSYPIPEQFKGKVVTLTFSASDAQDTVYDTAVLIDNIVVK